MRAVVAGGTVDAVGDRLAALYVSIGARGTIQFLKTVVQTIVTS